jgi:hypothetical protein
MLDVDNHAEEELSVDISEGWLITIHSNSFWFSGRCAKSFNGVYILAWKDAWLREHEGAGEEEFITGEYLLLENKNLIFKGILPRPSSGKVADNGTFIFNDCLVFSGDVPEDEIVNNFRAFSKMGEDLVTHFFSANLMTNGLSNDGRYALCATDYSITTDGNTVTCFDLVTGKLLWQKTPDIKLMQLGGFEFNAEENTIFYVYNNLGKFRYSMSGELLDDEQ